jgi:hypothetical protein
MTLMKRPNPLVREGRLYGLRIYANAPMRRVLGRISAQTMDASLAPFKRLLNAGIVRHAGGLYWRALIRGRLPRVGSRVHPDTNALEYGTNKIHVEDYVGRRTRSLDRLMAHALLLGHEVALRVSLMGKVSAEQIIGVDPEGQACTHALITHRRGEPYLDEDLEGFRDPVLRMVSTPLED